MSSSRFANKSSSSAASRFQSTMENYTNLRYITAFLGINLIAHACLGYYFHFYKGTLHDQLIDTITIVSTSVGIFCGIVGAMGGLLHSSSCTKVMIFGWLFMMLNQLRQTSFVLYMMHKGHKSLTSSSALYLVAETALLIGLEWLFVECLAEYVKMTKWYKKSQNATGAYEPLISNDDLEMHDAETQYVAQYNEPRMAQNIPAGIPMHSNYNMA